MNLKFNVSGARRKVLANAIANFLCAKVVYKHAPTYAYEVADFTIDRTGTVSYPADTNAERVFDLIAVLRERGFEAEESCRLHLHDNCDRLTIEMPRAYISLGALENLEKIVIAKGTLFKKAFGVDSIQIETTEHLVRFPWFRLTGADGEADAYAKFVSALCEMAKRQRRITAKEKESNNDKFDMRIFLIRLGFVGNDYKQARKILLRNLTGNSSFKEYQERTEEP
jgi:hypothetical protein